ncbi:hypothetical protein Y1Q_0006140 [Alligator mississippiensis]|uniref:Uncharacterized protein n=1 Tax=Alligator mississippiensis TaxID=8496 RepID=A0A151NXX7_ALLMI|nr:hypothetical protein Y1Q_0006140 [Alligator mississippiensis]
MASIIHTHISGRQKAPQDQYWQYIVHQHIAWQNEPLILETASLQHEVTQRISFIIPRQQNYVAVDFRMVYTGMVLC